MTQQYSLYAGMEMIMHTLHVRIYTQNVHMQIVNKYVSECQFS